MPRTSLWLALAALLLRKGASESTGQPREDDVAKVPLQLGYPVPIPDLEQNASRCFVIRLPDTPRVRILASAVGLAGTPILAGGWLPTHPGNESSSDAGFHILMQDLERLSPQYYVCVRTFSEQGCDAVLTVIAMAVQTAVEVVPPIRLRRDYPSVWRLGGPGRSNSAPASLQFTIEAEYLSDLRVSVVPLSGEVNLEVFDVPPETEPGQANVSLCSGQLLGSSALLGPDLIDIAAARQKLQRGGALAQHSLCILATGEGTLSITAGPHLPGPFMAPFIPAAGRFPGMGSTTGQVCEFFRLLVNTLADTVVTAVSEDNSRLTLAASLTSELFQPSGAHWSGRTPAGGTGAVLVVTHDDVARSQAEDVGELCLSVSVCRLPRKVTDPGPLEPARFWVTSVTDRGVVTVDDGFPVTTSVLPGHWREFRLLMPGGELEPGEITVSSTSTGKTQLVADTVRFPLQPSLYRWGSQMNSSHAILRLTTKPELASAEVHLVDCRLPCFLYLAASASCAAPSMAGNSGGGCGDLDLQLLAIGDGGTLKPLLEAKEVQETLQPGEAQVFRYRARSSDEAVLASLSTQEGEATLTLSALPSFPADPSLTTRPAHDVILLEPRSEIFGAATRQSMHGLPVLYLKVGHVSTAAPCTFTVVARGEKDAKVMWNGDDANGAVEAQGFDRYRFFLGEAEVKQGPVQVSIEVTPVLVGLGQLSVFVSCSPQKFPSREHHDWGRLLQGHGSLVFTSASPRFRPGWIYVALTSQQRAAFKVQISWGNATLELRDGVEEIGHVMAGDSRPFVALLGGPKPVAIRAEALTGAIRLCVANWRQDPGTAGCRHSAMAQAGQPELALAALDLSEEEVHGVGHLLLLVVGLSAASDFALRVLSTAPALLAGERRLVLDALGPPCCLVGPHPMLLTRTYLHYVPLRDETSSFSLELQALGLESLGRALVRARRSGAASWSSEVRARDADHMQRLRSSVELQQLLPRQGTEGPGRQGLWLEIEVQVETPLNYTLYMSSNASKVAPHLQPNVLVTANLSANTSEHYGFDWCPERARGRCVLRVMECYGHLSLHSRSLGHQAEQQAGGFRELPLLPPASASPTGSVILTAEGSSSSVAYQVELVTSDSSNLNALRMPDLDSLVPASGPDQVVSFSFSAASLSDTAAQWKACWLRYTLVVASQSDQYLNPNTSCGLEEAVRGHPRVLSAQREVRADSETPGQKTLTLPCANLSALLGKSRIQTPSLWANVLVELLGPDRQLMAARSYTACNVTAAQLSKWSATASQATGGLLPIVFVLTGVGAFWCLANYMGSCCMGDRSSLEEDTVELETHYDLHAGDQGRDHGGYVPPCA